MNATYKLKYWLRKLATLSPVYRNEYKSISFEANESNNLKRLERIVNYAIENVPYYKDYDKYINGQFNPKHLPIIRKEDLANNTYDFISKEFNRKRLFHTSTGGTTGVSTNIYSSQADLIRITAYRDFIFNIARLKNPVICSLGEHDLNQSQTHKFFGNKLMLSPSKINKETIGFYLKLMHDHKVNILHCYPSSLLIICKLLENEKHSLDIKEIVVSSEIFSSEVRDLAYKIFPESIIVNFYGQTEFLALGIGINSGPIRFFNNLSYIEFIDTGMSSNGNKIAEIVATNLSKKSMPLIRFAMGDYVELDSNNNVINIIGRTSEFLIDKNGHPLPCIVVNRPHTMDNVIIAQYYQDTVGEFLYKIVVNEKFKEYELKAIEEDIYLEFGDSIKGTVVIVDDVERSERGKHKKLIQKLDVSLYINN